jgi:hypothetical protein
MAYGIESYIYPSVLPKPNKLPYESAKIISDFIYPSFSANPLNLIALCDASLMLFNSGVFFYDLLYEMKRIGFSPSNPSDVYDFAYSNTPPFKFNGLTNIRDVIKKQAEDAISQLSGYFTTELFKDNNVWINHVINTGLQLRLQQPYFIITLIEDLSSKSNKAFSQLLFLVGSPLVVNDKQEMSMTLPTKIFNIELYPEYLFVINQIYSLYRDGINNDTLPCKMIQWCRNSATRLNLPDHVNYLCQTEPWRRALDPDPNPCPFGRVWKTWELKDYDLQSPS